MRRTRGTALAIAVTALFSLVACAGGSRPGHTFEIIEEDGVPVAVSSTVPKYDGELFTYEKVLVIRPDPADDESILYQPFSFTLGDDGLYYVADRGNHRIAVFDAEGNFVRAFGREGQGPGELQDPLLVEIRDGVVAVLGDRTSRFRSDGTFIDVLSGGRFARLADDGTLVFEGTTRETREDGDRYYGARARMVDDNGEVVAEVETRQVPSSVFLQYSGAPSVFLLPGNEILATTGIEPTISWYGLDGRLKRKARIDLASQPVTEADRAAVDGLWDRYIERTESTGGSAFVSNLLEMKAQTLYPETKTFWRRPIVADNGWLWLPGPVAEMRMSLSGSAPIAVRPRFRVVDARGEFIGVTEWPSEALDPSGSQIVDGRLLTMVWDEEAEEIVPTVYRIRAAVEGLVYP